MIRNNAADMAAKLVAGEITSVALTQAHLDRIAAVDTDVHAFLHIDTEGALAQAAAVDAKRAKGEKLSPLSWSSTCTQRCDGAKRYSNNMWFKDP